ncbi:hypothetical protein NUU61_000954 [Penicillium alfredii]|uniref:Uncharacterized protein n=1 Tax=Penicillium alfredii TaxID=1506179 RepID=A0A9W9GAJ2_9EURO|nr:uncharacterized protein NUU61_000954 [Penicillium alfredii]KAJ5115195.1 hypothetical protein NUU61_000954 [Penicillium alfredii]
MYPLGSCGWEGHDLGQLIRGYVRKAMDADPLGTHLDSRSLDDGPYGMQVFRSKSFIPFENTVTGSPTKELRWESSAAGIDTFRIRSTWDPSDPMRQAIRPDIARPGNRLDHQTLVGRPDRPQDRQLATASDVRPQRSFIYVAAPLVGRSASYPGRAATPLPQLMIDIN